jgi:1-acyl-sn-glycerol-3-phosphate acyltransferase
MTESPREFPSGIFKRWVYDTLRLVARITTVLLFDLRCYGRENLQEGAALVLSTHQSNLDPILVGVVFNDRLSYLARRTLFKNSLFAAFIRLLDAIELDRDRSGLAGLKETLKRLKSNQKVLVFPEGTRSPNGQICALRPGFLAVARRSRVPLVPLAVTGAFEALPRGCVWPRRYPLRVSVGNAIDFSEYDHLTDDEALELISGRLHRCRDIAESLRKL